ncbi:MAG TPA: HlyD family secretion protein [Cyclobacteriaceae bacterium]|jgi:membrane fusion protein (multidrug efflux system)|nr:HlyD family secretion protein [Cyclobacteriaceae bacterium]
MKKNLIYVALGIALIAGGFYGWNYYKFITSHIETDDAQIDGNIVPVLSRVGSFVASVRVKDNELVQKGQLLVELDSVDLISKFDQAKAAYESSKISIAVAQSAVEDAKLAEQLSATSIEEPKTNLWKATKEYERYSDLYNQKLATPQQLDNVKADLEKAQAQYNVALQRDKSAQGQYKTAQSQLHVAEANVSIKAKDLDYAKLQLSYTKVHAPVTGFVSKKSIQPGQLIQAGQPLMALVQDKEIWVTANFKETQLEGMNIGNAVDIKVDAFPGKAFSGKVQSMGGATGAKFSLLPPDNAAGNFVKVVQRLSVRISVDPTPDAMNLLKPGLSVKTIVSKN